MSIKIGFATSDGERVNEHFGRCGSFSIYEIGPEGYHYVETRRYAQGRDCTVEETRGMGQIHDDIMEVKASSLSDCKILYVLEIGGPSAARLVKRNMMPVKVKEEVLIEDIMNELLDKINTSPPPWLRKALQAGS